MVVLEGLAGLRSVPVGTVLSVGNFDGIHRGHQSIFATAAAARAGDGAAGFTVITFEPHPLTVLRPALAPPRLTPPSVKNSLLQAAGVSHLVILPPTSEVLNLAAEDFWAILRDQVRPTRMVEGRSFNFGKGRGGTIEKLRGWVAQSAVKLDVISPVSVSLVNLQVVPVSSSLVRWLLVHGRVRDAAICLNRGYELEGEVIKGFQRGRGIGVPTANLSVPDQLVPADGVYAGRCCVDGTTYPVAISIGTLPTFGETRRQIEAHLIGYSGDLYGRVLRVEFVDWLREQMKFGGIEALKTQLGKDIDVSRNRFQDDPARTAPVS